MADLQQTMGNVNPDLVQQMQQNMNMNNMPGQQSSAGTTDVSNAGATQSAPGQLVEITSLAQLQNLV